LMLSLSDSSLTLPKSILFLTISDEIYSKCGKPISLSVSFKATKDGIWVVDVATRLETGICIKVYLYKLSGKFSFDFAQIYVYVFVASGHGFVIFITVKPS